MAYQDRLENRITTYRVQFRPVEKTPGTGNSYRDVIGIPVSITDKEFKKGDDGGSYILTREGLICLKRDERSGDLAVGRQIRNWREIERLTRFSRTLVLQILDRFEEPSVDRSISSEEDPEEIRHWKMMQRAGDYR